MIANFWQNRLKEDAYAFITLASYEAHLTIAKAGELQPCQRPRQEWP